MATILPGDESAIELSLRSHPCAGVAGMDLSLLWVHYLAHDDHPGFNFLTRLRQPCKNCSSFIEYLVHALQLTGLDCVLLTVASCGNRFSLAFYGKRRGHVGAFLLGCAFLSLLFIPRLGRIEIDSQARRITFREGLVERSLYPVEETLCQKHQSSF